jgi:hypothetical protein
MRPRKTASSGGSDSLGVLRCARLVGDTGGVHDLAHYVHMVENIKMREDIQSVQDNTCTYRSLSHLSYATLGLENASCRTWIFCL